MSSTDDRSLRHIKALKSAFDFANASSVSWDGGADKCCAGELQRARAYLAQGVPCGAKTDLVEFFLSTTWSGRIDYLELWREYVEAGYVDTASPLLITWKRSFVRVLPLEAAIIYGHQKAFDGLLEAGASISAVPSRPWKVSKKTGKSSIKDIFGFIKFVVRDPGSRIPYEVASTKVMMDEVIARGAVGPKPVKTPKAPKGAKRSMLAGKEDSAVPGLPGADQVDLAGPIPLMPITPVLEVVTEVRSEPITNARMRRRGI